MTSSSYRGTRMALGEREVLVDQRSPTAPPSPAESSRNTAERHDWRLARPGTALQRGLPAAVQEAVGTSAPECELESTNSSPESGRILVAISAYEDPELEITIRSLLHAAEHPERIVIGVVWQGAGKCPALEPRTLRKYEELLAADETCRAGEISRPASPSNVALSSLGFSPRYLLGGHLRVLELPASEAKGPCWARYLCELFWEGEPWFCQTDSHMRFAEGWDTGCIADVKASEALHGSRKAMLSCYGAGGFERGAAFDWAVTSGASPPLVLCASHFDRDAILQLRGHRAKDILDAPRRNAFFSANFSFSPGARVAEVAYDPQLQYLFYGEEVLMGVRLYTAGWDVFTPTRAWAFHLWEKDYRKHFDDTMDAAQHAIVDASIARVLALLGGDAEGGKGGGKARHAMWPRPNGAPPERASDAAFGLGRARTVASFEGMAGVHFTNQRVGDKARNGFLEPEEIASAADVLAEEGKDIDDIHDEMIRAAREVNRPTVASLASGSVDEVALSGKTVEEILAPPKADLTMRTLKGALPEELAREARTLLSALPPDAWEVAQTKDQPLDDGAKRVEMRYRRNPTADEVEPLKERIQHAILGVIRPRPFERLLLNFSRYDAGDFLDSHGDTPSGSKCYERRLAFVWHLSEGWRNSDGGLFIDEEARGGEKAIAPTFNTLVTFPVPRMHRVTKVTARGKPRFAVYGWVTTPEIHHAPSARMLRSQLHAHDQSADTQTPMATAVLLLPQRPDPDGARALVAFATQPQQEMGLGHCFGDYCTFVVGHSDAASRALLLGSSARGAADDDSPVLHVLPPCSKTPSASAAHAAGASTPRGVTLHDISALSDVESLTDFVGRERKQWTPCPELDLRDQALMAEMYFSAEVKVFILVRYGDRPVSLMAKIAGWARMLKPQVRFYLAEPELAAPILEEFGLRPDDAPTLVGYDTQGTHNDRVPGRYRMVDLYGGKKPPVVGLDQVMMVHFVKQIAKLAKVDPLQLTALK